MIPQISAICQEAGMHAVRKNRYVILPKDFEKGYRTNVKKPDTDFDFYKWEDPWDFSDIKVIRVTRMGSLVQRRQKKHATEPLASLIFTFEFQGWCLWLMMMTWKLCFVSLILSEIPGLLASVPTINCWLRTCFWFSTWGMELVRWRRYRLVLFKGFRLMVFYFQISFFNYFHEHLGLPSWDFSGTQRCWYFVAQLTSLSALGLQCLM